MGLSETELDRLTHETVDLLRGLIRNECVNDGTGASGHEDRSARILEGEFEGLGLDIERYETAPGQSSVVTRYEGTDPEAPSLCFMAHTDVVPVTPDGWTRDPFGGELITNADGISEVWGRGALGDLYDQVTFDDSDAWPASASPVDTRLWDALETSMGFQYADKDLVPSMVTGGTDARFYRDKGAVAYGAGLLSPSLDAVEFLTRFHGHDERIDVESLRMTTRLWVDLVDVLWD